MQRGGRQPRRAWLLAARLPVRRETRKSAVYSMPRGGATYRTVTDNQVSVRLVVNAATGEVAQRLDYDSFGRVLCDTNPCFQPFGFQGGLYDPDTGLVEFGCRWYDAETGRWISKDPILLDGGWNVYAFCDNDPVNRTDPSGLYSFWQWTSQVIGAVSGAAQIAGGILLAGATSGIGTAASVVMIANGAAAMGASIKNIWEMSSRDDAKLLGNSGVVGLTTSLATDSPMLNGIAGGVDLVLSCGASGAACGNAVYVMTSKLQPGTWTRYLYDYNYASSTLTQYRQLLSAEDIAKQAFAATKLERTLSAVGCGGTAYDSGCSVMKAFK